MAPKYLYRLLSHRFSLFGLTQVRKGDSLQVFARLEDDKIMEIWDDGELLYMSSENITLYTVQAIVSNQWRHNTFRGLAA